MRRPGSSRAPTTKLLARANAPTEAGATNQDIEAKDTCSGGRAGAAQVCNYDAAWTRAWREGDAGSTVSRATRC